MAEKDNGPHGVGGWLALLVAGMVVFVNQRNQRGQAQYFC